MATRVFPQEAIILCDTGYSLDQSRSPATTSHQVRCKNDGEYTAEMPCRNVECGVAEEVDHTTRGSDTTYVVDEVQRILKKGSTLDGTAHGVANSTAMCNNWWHILR